MAASAIFESGIDDAVLDFMEFCNFIETARPFATQKGDLSTKGCFEVNKFLRHSKTDAKQTDRLHHYPSVSLWFAVAKEAGIIAEAPAKGGKIVYSTTDRYADFKK